MCGIVGAVFYKGNDINVEQKMIRALDKIAHRGPDDDGLEMKNFNSITVALGHTRLSIIDLSSGGHQPMSSNCKRYEIIYNGEIYNYKELRTELINLGHIFKTESDTEVLIACWSEWQENCLKKLEGMFAFAVIDIIDKTVTCARDAFGIKPLFYARENNNLYFGSDIKSIRELKTEELTLNEQRAYDYLVNGDYDSNNQTFYEEVNQLAPASYIKFSIEQPEKKIKEIRWWTPSIKENKNITFDDAAEIVKNNFIDSIRKHLRSDVSIGTALSGGLDSSSIVYLIRHLDPNITLNTFSYIAQDEYLSEENWVDKVNDDVNAIPHKIKLTTDCLFKEIDDLIISQGEPFGSTSIYAQYKVFEKAKLNNVKVTLDGQGADELLAGYSGYPGPRIKSLIKEIKIKKAIAFLINWSKWPGRSISQGLMYSIQSLVPRKYNHIARKISGRKFNPSWLNTAYLFSKNIKMSEKIYEIFDDEKNRYLMKSLRSSLINRGLPGLLRHADRNSMAFSIESRVPFCTIKQAEFLFSLPEEFLISSDGETKSVLRHALRGIVPDEVLDRKDKIGFATPEKDWLLNNFNNLYKIMLDSNFPMMLEKQKTLDKLMNFKNNIENDWRQIWRIYNFVRWYNLNFH